MSEDKYTVQILVDSVVGIVFVEKNIVFSLLLILIKNIVVVVKSLREEIVLEEICTWTSLRILITYHRLL